jgi:tetratricopeptide (TPR) repeat protein
MWKNSIAAIALIASCILQGCKLDVDDDNKMPGDKFWNTGTPANAEAFVLSVYNCLRVATTTNGFFLYSGDLRCAPVTNITSSNGVYHLLKNDMKTYRSVYDSKEEGTSRECGAIYNWEQMYAVIQSANLMIEEVGNVPGLSLEEQEGYKAECVFLRNLAYFFLVRLFGDVPYYTNAYSGNPLPKTSMTEVLENCLADLQAVIDNDPDHVALPWRKKAGGLRANRGAALTLMMHVNMWLACFDSDNAVDYYREVKRLAEIDSWVDGPYYSLLPIELSTDIFKGNSNEGLFEIAQNITTGEVFATAHAWCTQVVYECLNKTTPTYVYSLAFLQELYPFEETDKRKEYWFTSLFYDLNGDLAGSLDSKGITRSVEIVKMLNQDKAKVDGSTITVANGGNYIVFRLADAILLYAEALDKLGETDKALQEVNRVRERAGATPFTSPDLLSTVIYWERVRELMGEGQYFYDLVRTGKLCDQDFSTFIDGSGYRERRANFLQGAWTWPIFKGALENNPNMSKNLYWE